MRHGDGNGAWWVLGLVGAAATVASAKRQARHGSPSKGVTKKGIDGLINFVLMRYHGLPSVIGKEWPSCAEVSIDLARAIEEYDRTSDVLDEEPSIIEGYFGGIEDYYHVWVEISVDGKVYIVDGARKQFASMTRDESDVAIFLKSSKSGKDYLTEAEL